MRLRIVKEKQRPEKPRPPLKALRRAAEQGDAEAQDVDLAFLWLYGAAKQGRPMLATV